jgi:predicted outer membrane protein
MQRSLPRPLTFGLALAALAMLGACRDTPQTDRPGSSESAGGSVVTPDGDTVPNATAVTTDTTQHRGAMRGDTASDTATDTAGATNPATFTAAHTFAMVDNANSAEVSAAGIALEKATSQGVKEFASRLARSHRTLLHTSRKLSSRLDIHPEATSDSALINLEEAMLDSLHDARSGPGFDTLFRATQVRTHQALLSSVRAARRTTQDDDVRALLDSTLSMLGSHLQAAQRLQRNPNP